MRHNLRRLFDWSRFIFPKHEISRCPSIMLKIQWFLRIISILRNFYSGLYLITLATCRMFTIERVRNVPYLEFKAETTQLNKYLHLW